MNKVPIWAAWDWKSIRIFAIVLLCCSVLGLIFLDLSDWIRDLNGRNLTIITTGDYISSKPIEQLSQGRTGNKTVTEGYEINYSYWVINKIYYGVDKIPSGVKNLKFIHLLFANTSQKLNIKYDPVHPEKSQIVIPTE